MASSRTCPVEEYAETRRTIACIETEKQEGYLCLTESKGSALEKYRVSCWCVKIRETWACEQLPGLLHRFGTRPNQRR